MRASGALLRASRLLAGVEVLCADKTGTLTQNLLTLGDPLPAAALASNAKDPDTIDAAVPTEPGLSVITLALEEARCIFERMASYAAVRIDETIRVLLFMTLAIVVFDF
ncbi:MAG: hypothetical protein OEU93_08855 [Rubrivivax sp.]|nr:hypothetical protein [Rubrivivax sp.]